MTSSCHYYVNWAYIFQKSIYNVFLQDKGVIWTMGEEATALEDKQQLVLCTKPS